MVEPIQDIERKWITDFKAFARSNLKIQDKGGKLVGFNVNEVQDIVLDIFRDIQLKGRLIRVLILKARRPGISTLIEGRNYWHTSTKGNRYSMVITHEPEATEFLFNMVRRFQTHNVWAPEERYNSKRILEFNDETGKRGLDSAMRIGTAGKEDFGGGQLVHFLHLSELAKYPAHSCTALLTSILQCVPDHHDTEVVMEFTGKGVGGEAHRRYLEARYRYEVFLDTDDKPSFRVEINEDSPEDNEYSSIFIPYFVFAEYQREPSKHFVLGTKENPHEKYGDEQHLLDLYGLQDKHLAWRRWAIENKCGGKEENFQQEYPMNAREAFQATGTCPFNIPQLEKLAKNAPKPIARYDCLISNGQWLTHPKGKLKVWKEPESSRSYVIAADVAEGLVKGDFDSADVVDQLTGEQVAQYHGKMDTDQFAKVLFYLGMRYNAAWLAPERNFHGLSVVQDLFKLEYPKMYVEVIKEPPNKPRQRLGWLTNKATKPSLVDNLVKELRDGTHGIKCKQTFEEMMTFKQVDKTYGAEEGDYFDDRVLSIGIALKVRTTFPLPSAYTGPGAQKQEEPSPNACN